MGFGAHRVWGLGFRVYKVFCLGFEAWFRAEGLWGLGLMLFMVSGLGELFLIIQCLSFRCQTLREPWHMFMGLCKCCPCTAPSSAHEKAPGQGQDKHELNTPDCHSADGNNRLALVLGDLDWHKGVPTQIDRMDISKPGCWSLTHETKPGL